MVFSSMCSYIIISINRNILGITINVFWVVEGGDLFTNFLVRTMSIRGTVRILSEFICCRTLWIVPAFTLTIRANCTDCCITCFTCCTTYAFIIEARIAQSLTLRRINAFFTSPVFLTFMNPRNARSSSSSIANIKRPNSHRTSTCSIYTHRVFRI